MSEPTATQFNVTIRKIMEVLVESCPVPKAISAEALGLESGTSESPGRYTLSADEVFVRHCINWLANEHFVLVFRDEVVATLKGLEAFGTAPACLTE